MQTRLFCNWKLWITNLSRWLSPGIKLNKRSRGNGQGGNERENPPHRFWMGWCCAKATNQSTDCYDTGDIGYRWLVASLWISTLIAKFMGLTWGLPGADRTQVASMLVTWTLLYRTDYDVTVMYHHLYLAVQSNGLPRTRPLPWLRQRTQIHCQLDLWQNGKNSMEFEWG